jgi:hypothetical protein
MKTYGTVRCSSSIHNLGTKWRRVVSFTPLPLYPRGKSSQYPSHVRLVGSQNCFGRCGERKYLMPLPGIESQFFGHPAVPHGGGELGRCTTISFTFVLYELILPSLFINDPTIQHLQSGRLKASLNKPWCFVLRQSSALKMETVRSSETSVNFYQSSWRQILQDNTLHKF